MYHRIKNYKKTSWFWKHPTLERQAIKQIISENKRKEVNSQIKAYIQKQHSPV